MYTRAGFRTKVVAVSYPCIKLYRKKLLYGYHSVPITIIVHVTGGNKEGQKNKKIVTKPSGLNTSDLTKKKKIKIIMGIRTKNSLYTHADVGALIF